MGELGAPAKLIDVFQGRAPRTVLGKYYTGNGLERLKRVYDKANLEVFAQACSENQNRSSFPLLQFYEIFQFKSKLTHSRKK